VPFLTLITSPSDGDIEIGGAKDAKTKAPPKRAKL
jgi:hypothetical protein